LVRGLEVDGLTADADTVVRRLHSLPGLNEAGNKRCLGFVDGIVDGRSVTEVQDLNPEDTHGYCGAHFVVANEGHIEGQDLIGIPWGGYSLSD
jgi:hypothetical protein